MTAPHLRGLIAHENIHKLGLDGNTMLHTQMRETMKPLLLVALVMTPPPSFCQPHVGSIQIRVVDVFGRSVKARVVSFREAFGGSELKSKFQGLFLGNSPRTRYDYHPEVVDKPPPSCEWLPVQGALIVANIRTHASIVASPDCYGGDAATTSRMGRIEPAPPAGVNAWVRFSRLYGAIPQTSESRIDAKGAFSIEAALEGGYAVSIHSGQSILHIRTVNMEPGEHRLPLVLQWK